MQNIEKYFGYRVILTDELDPARVEVLKEKAERIRALNDFSEDEYVVYFHQMTLLPLSDHFAADLTIEKKIHRLDLNFAVNQKQVRNGKIKLFNFLLDEDYSREIKQISHAHAINYMLQGSALENKYGFRNEIVTFVDKTLRKDHRKLKVSVTCRPTDEFKKVIHKEVDSHLTQIDFKLESRNVKLLDRKVRKKHIIENKEGDVIVSKTTYINSGQVGAQGDNATSSRSTFNQQVISSADMVALLAELPKLRAALKAVAEPDNREQDKVIGTISMAEEAAEKGDQEGVMKYLKSSGKWALETSEKIGTAVLTAYIKDGLGI
ncbi:hypothetical protein [Marinobacter salsuginis]|uniref:hypothetical protein n=1 Tax=Marinobacter salsuginis TaxID=418719 RepID=UPI00273E10E2|nr:hypothetical protein [Marinobacter salsuginis]